MRGISRHCGPACGRVGRVKPSGRMLIALALLGVAMGVAAHFIILSTDHISHREVWSAFNAAIGTAFVGTGLYAWWRTPSNRSGALFTWVGFLFFLSSLGFSNHGLP